MNSTISHYRILKKLGAGGMGEVYLAEDTKLDRTVALKILPSEFVSDHERMSRFVREAKAASAVQHPNVAHIYEISEEQGIHFIAMEYVEGESLAEEIKKGPLGVMQVIEIALQAADALDEMESKGITHRDIKPSNIMMTRRGQIKILDFGVAKVRRDANEAEATHAATLSQTEPGMAIGTVPYMSPEQALGRPIDHRTDLFSLGAVLYQMVTGRLPFSGSTAGEMIDHIVHREPEAVARFNYEVPAGLERIIRKCLEKDPERRYQSSRELCIDLRNLKRDLDTGTAQMAGGAGEKAARRMPLLWMAAVLLLLMLVGVATNHFFANARTIESVAILPLSSVGGDQNMEYLSDGITESLINSLSQLPRLKVMSRSSVFRYKDQLIDPQIVGRDLKVQAVVTGRVVPRGDTLSIDLELVDARDNHQIWGEQYNRKLSDLVILQEEITREILKELRLKLSNAEEEKVARHSTESNVAYNLYLKGRFYWYQFNEDGLRKAVQYFSQAIQADPNFALAYVGLADSYNAIGVNYILPPKEIFPKAKAAAEKALALDENQAEAHIAMGVYKVFYEWDWSGAKYEAERAKALSPKYARSVELNTDHSNHFYCFYLDVLGRPLDSVAEHKHALMIDPLSFMFYAEMGWSYYIARQYDQAIEQAQKGVEMDPGLLLAYLSLGNAYREKGMNEKGIAELRKASSLAAGDPYVSAELAFGLATSSHKGEAEKILAELKDRSTRERIDPGNIAIIYNRIRCKGSSIRMAC